MFRFLKFNFIIHFKKGNFSYLPPAPELGMPFGSCIIVFFYNADKLISKNLRINTFAWKVEANWDILVLTFAFSALNYSRIRSVNLVRSGYRLIHRWKEGVHICSSLGGYRILDYFWWGYLKSLGFLKKKLKCHFIQCLNQLNYRLPYPVTANSFIFSPVSVPVNSVNRFRSTDRLVNRLDPNLVWITLT